MSLQFGLNLKKKGPAPARKTIFDDVDDEDDQPSEAVETSLTEISTFSNNAPSRPAPRLAGKTKAVAKPQRLDDQPKSDLFALQAAKAKIKVAEDLDASIFDYDSFHDVKSSVNEAKKAADRQDAIERKPKYINNLLDAAARRKQDQQVAKEKLLQKEREAEGDEFADKEKFVTGAYKLQQEENRKLEEEERKKAEAEEKKKRGSGGGMQGFYRSMMDQSEKLHQETMEAAKKMEMEGGARSHDEEKKKSDAEIAAEMKAQGVNVHLNEEGQVLDKRELLSAGLNVVFSGKASDSKGADHLRSSNRPALSAFQNRNSTSQQAQRERQTRMLEEQLAAQNKRAREEEEEERERVEKAAKTTKTDKDVSDAKARYLARKGAKERGEG